MDEKLFAKIQATKPVMNPYLANGIVTYHMQSQVVEEYISRYIQEVAVNFPPGLSFCGIEHPTPQEAYAEIARTSKNKRGRAIYDMAHSDLYLVRLHFRLEKTDIYKHIFLPYVGEGGTITIRDSKYLISPMVADKALSVGDNQIFTMIGKTKLTFFRVIQHFVVEDGGRVASNVVWSKIYRVGDKKKLICKTSNVHYIFCKYGFTQAFAHFGGAEVECNTHFDETRYPRDQWMICASTQIKPPSLGNIYYRPTEMKIAIKREHYNLHTAAMIAAFFYVVDHFPDRIRADEVDDVTTWHTLLGYIIFGDTESEGRIINATQTHLTSVDGYIDSLDRKRYASRGIHIEDFYELLMYLVRQFPELISKSSESLASMYGKELSTWRYILSDIIHGINRVDFDIRKEIAKPGKVLTPNAVISILQNRLQANLITAINRAEHPEVTSVSSSSDNIIWKLTSNSVLQSNVTGAPTAGKTVKFDMSLALHASIAEISSYPHNAKSEPTGRKFLNMYAECDIEGTFSRKRKFVKLLDSAQEEIKR